MVIDSPIEPLGVRSARSAAGPRRDGALVGLMIGVLATVPAVIEAVANGSIEWWILASIPAGSVAGAAVAPAVVPGARIAIRTIVASAAVAFLAGDAVVCVAILVLYAPRNDWSVLTALANTVAMFLLGMVTVDWLAMLVLLPVAAVGAFVLRARLARHGERPS
jgi:hypothetical protein